MKGYVRVLVAGLALLTAFGAVAATPTGNLAGCLVDHLNGKERKDLAKWVFFSMGAHPDIKPYLDASPGTIEASDKFVGSLITRLLVRDCPNKLRTANKADPLAIQKAFTLVGQVAMQELMTNQNVRSALANYTKYANKDAINNILNDK